MSEKQFKLFFKRAERKKGITGETLLSMLERRLDNVVFLIGFSHSRYHARQLLVHGHFQINGRKVATPSILIEKGDVLSFRDKSINHDEFKAIVEYNKSKSVPGWLEVDREKMEVRVLTFPSREEVGIPIEEHLVVELYSR
jgi:small subunit ribosomal protein S4